MVKFEFLMVICAYYGCIKGINFGIFKNPEVTLRTMKKRSKDDGVYIDDYREKFRHDFLVLHGIRKKYKIEGDLSYEHKRFSDIESGSELSEHGDEEVVVELYLSGCKLKYVPLEVNDLKYLRYLSLSSNKIKKIDVLDLPYLTKLELVDNELVNLEGFEGMPNISKLWVQGNKIKDISGIAKLEKLEMVNLSHNLIEDISPISGLRELREINFSWNQIKKIPKLRDLPKLRKILLNRNEICEIKNLQNLKLTYILFSNNKIKKIENLENNKELVLLDLTHNNLKTLYGIGCIQNKKCSIYIGKNFISWEDVQHYSKEYPNIRI
jgi:Leucine-rich repeat (LRR) protein